MKMTQSTNIRMESKENRFSVNEQDKQTKRKQRTLEREKRNLDVALSRLEEARDNDKQLEKAATFFVNVILGSA
jgi:hypothetical protein